MIYPDAAAVEVAEREQLCAWYRFLPSPTKEQRPLMARIIERFNEAGGFSPEISKRLGWRPR